mmetsp:Transcript_79709/g.125719  ORF Transcript_79709/g.125719 Transcript_79709/m.125719 type:complete len:218 (+) Transcript_79709:954-1607(+)
MMLVFIARMRWVHTLLQRNVTLPVLLVAASATIPVSPKHFRITEDLVTTSVLMTWTDWLRSLLLKAPSSHIFLSLEFMMALMIAPWLRSSLPKVSTTRICLAAMLPLVAGMIWWMSFRMDAQRGLDRLQPCQPLTLLGTTHFTIFTATIRKRAMVLRQIFATSKRRRRRCNLISDRSTHRQLIPNTLSQIHTLHQSSHHQPSPSILSKVNTTLCQRH